MDKVMEKPMTTSEFFRLLCERLKARNAMPEDLLDYYDPADWKARPMRTCEFNLKTSLNYGGSEGIYLDLAVEEYIDGRWQTTQIGTCKTLDESNEAMKRMAELLADFIIEEREYVNSHLDDFTWTGYDVKPDNGGFGWSCASYESAMQKKDEMLVKHDCVIVRDNAIRKETKYYKEMEA